MGELESRGPDAADSHQLVDGSGKPLHKRVSPWQRWRDASRPARVVGTAITSIAVLAGILTIVVYSHEIVGWFGGSQASPEVPPIVLKISNATGEVRHVVSRGEFLLWLPGGGGRYTPGTYDLLDTTGNPFSSGLVDISPGTTVTVLVDVRDDATYAEVLARGDCDVSLHLVSQESDSAWADLPFTPEAIESYFATAAFEPVTNEDAQ